ncbi:MAG: hypothetical protein Q7Q73_07685 [Verrucomicrobiota bacterium JB024]|nr:hypothetical protein [Verrucomicrobiota bacterium JB024]
MHFRYLIALLSLFTVLPTFAIAQERVARLEFPGNGEGIAVSTIGSGPAVFTAELIRPQGQWQAPQCAVEVLDFWDRAQSGWSVDAQVKGATITLTVSAEQPEPGWYCLNITVRDGEGEWTVDRTLDDGMGRDIPQLKSPMICLVPEPRTIEDVPDCPVAIDTLITSSNREVSDEIQLVLTRLLGVRWARERIAWGWIESRPGKYDMDGSSMIGNQYQHATRARAITDDFYNNGISVLEVFHGVPAWTTDEEGNEFKVFPNDLRVFYRWLKDMASIFSPSVKAWSIWNEQDIGFFCAEPPDQYAAMVKAGSLALRESPARPLVFLGAFARDPRVGGYAEILFENGVSPYVDVYDFHSYAPVNNGMLAEAIDTNLTVAREHGIPHAWLTETAYAFPKSSPPTLSASRQKQVRYLLDAYTTAFSHGVSHAFWHSLRPAAPFASHQFGMLNANLEPFPVYQAMAVMANQLGRGQYLGSFTNANGASVQLYQDGDVEVAYVDADSDTIVIDSEDSSGLVATDVMGGRLALSAVDGGMAVKNDGWPFYVRGTAWKGRITQQPVPPVAPADNEEPSGVVVRPRFPRECVLFTPDKPASNWDGVATNWAPRGYAFKEGESVPASVEVYNFSSRTVSGDIWANMPAGAEADTQTQPYTVEPGGRAVVTFTLTFEGEGGVVTFEAVTADGDLADLSVSKWTPKP